MRQWVSSILSWNGNAGLVRGILSWNGKVRLGLVQWPVSAPQRRNEVSHIVIYKGSDGNTAYRECDGVEQAAAIVEELRNKEGVDDARICSLREIRFEMRPAYRVEIAPDAADPAQAAAPVAAATAPVPAPPPPPPAEAAAAEPVIEAAPPPPASSDAPSAFSAFSAEPAQPVAAPAPAPEPPAEDTAAEGEPKPAPARRGLFGR